MNGVMARRRRRVGCSVLAGTLLGAAAWWADWAGYGRAGAVLGAAAGVAVLAGAWRTGGRHLSWAEEPPPDAATLPPDAAAPRPGEGPGTDGDRER
ncbi:hypothetical protein [Streptomyces sp. NPDC059389]|uniref:hypothetical protein n=1 Tax=Streptomyces sp. NPDC059389 TaxID=3346818 RepID=UPI003698CDA5